MLAPTVHQSSDVWHSWVTCKPSTALWIISFNSRICPPFGLFCLSVTKPHPTWLSTKRSWLAYIWKAESRPSKDILRNAVSPPLGSAFSVLFSLSRSFSPAVAGEEGEGFMLLGWLRKFLSIPIPFLPLKLSSAGLLLGFNDNSWNSRAWTKRKKKEKKAVSLHN